MKNVLRLIIISALFFIPSLDSKATEDIAEELLETKHENEVVLNPDETLVLNETPHKTNEQEIEQNNIEQTPAPKKKLFNFDFDDDDDDDIMDNTELDFAIFKRFDEEKKVTEDTLFGKIYNSEIRRTDVPSFLLQDDLTFEYKKGPVSKIHAFGAYRGSVNSLWKTDYSTNYDNLTSEIGLYGSFRNPDYKFKVMVNPIPVKGLNFVDRFISDTYIVNTSIPNHQIVAGYSRVQTGVEGGVSTYVLPFVTRSQIARNFGNARSLSLKIVGNYQYADYNLSVGSSGRYITSGMPGAEFNGWLNLKPFGNKHKKYGKLTIGGGFNGGHNGIDYSVLSGYVGYHHKRLWANFEAAIADGYNGSRGVSSNKACGYAVTAGWKFNPHFQLIGRIDQFDPNRDASNDLKREYTIGINWFIKGQALKVILNYVFCDNQNMPDSHKIILATQIVL